MAITNPSAEISRARRGVPRGETRPSASGAYPLVWTTGLMAPEAYTLKSALDGWIAGENGEEIRDRAAGAYDKYQKCGVRAAHRLLVSGW